MLTTKEFWLVIGIGVPAGLFAVFSGIVETNPYAGEKSSRTHESEQQLLQAQMAQGVQQEQLERQTVPATEEMALIQARAILSRPHTLHQERLALQVLNGQPSAYQPSGLSGSQDDNSGYDGPNYAGGAASTAMGTAPQSRSSSLYRSNLDQPSASSAWLARHQRASTQEHGSATADFDEGTINSAGAVSVGGVNTGAINVRTGRYYAPAGPSGYVNTQDGTYYSRSGPNGVVNTRTGEYLPTTP
jgi:hypothetical protein